MTKRTMLGTDTNGLFLGDLVPGAMVGAYRIDALFSARGSGIVYRATHAVLPRRVLLKVLPTMESTSSAVALQLMREACIVEALDHPGVSRVYECGLLPDGRPWVASEHVDGTPLSFRIDHACIEPTEVIELLRDVAEILEHAHRRGVIHCGLGPDTIITPERTTRFPVCISDWSEARTVDSTSPLPLLPRLPARPFQAPEQHGGWPVIDARIDIYALGAIAHRALFGVLPGASRPGGRPPDLVALIDRMLAQNPDARPTISEVCDACSEIRVDDVDVDLDDAVIEDEEVALDDDIAGLDVALDLDAALSAIEVDIDL